MFFSLLQQSTKSDKIDPITCQLPTDCRSTYRSELDHNIMSKWTASKQLSRTMTSSLPSDSNSSNNSRQSRRQRNISSSSNEIATFSRMASASASDEEDNISIISLHEEFYDDQDDGGEIMMIRRGLVDYCDLRGCGTGSTVASSSSLEEQGAEGYNHSDVNGEERSSLIVSSQSSLSQESGMTQDNNHAQDDDDSLCCCHLIISRARSNPALSLTATILIVICTIYFLTSDQFHNINLHRTTNYIRSKTHQFGTKKSAKQTTNTNDVTFRVNPLPLDAIFQYPPFPAKELLGMTDNSTDIEDANIDPPYNPSDFYYQNEAGRNRTLTYWEEVVAAIEEFQENYTNDEGDDGLVQMKDEEEDISNMHESFVTTPWTNISSWGPCFPRIKPLTNDKQTRSLLRKKKKQNKPKSKSLSLQNWTYIVQNNDIDTNDETSIQYPTYKRSYPNKKEEYLGGLCRPGFLIIGQGKCGTSSLYKYLTGHDRVLPAVKKQIHYFIFNTNKSLKWYYSNFPTIESFLGTGTLMTGEASPGYMPYPSVIQLLVKRLSPTEPDKLSAYKLEAYTDNIKSLPKIISVVRDPIERAVSSYKYNYIVPALTKLKRGQGMTASGKPIPGGRTEQFYQDYLYTFEELALAELATLKECLQPGGRGETYSYNHYGKYNRFFHGTFESRANSSKTPMIDLDGACYEDTKSQFVPRVQWIELAKRIPDKILDLANLQLTQSIIGRGVYIYPLEWWYEVFASASVHGEEWIHTVCTEEMGDNPVDTMDDVSSFLGLPEFDFRNTTSVGRYNVGGHRGYDTVTTADEESDEHDEPLSPAPESNSSPIGLTSISDEVMTELMEFYRPYNERLFALIGKRCTWKE